MPTDTNDITGRIEYLDIMKGIAMLIIITYHVYEGPMWLVYISNGVCVPMFFFISGMFVNGSAATGTFALRRFNRLIVPMMFFSLLYMAAAVVIPDFSVDVFKNAGNPVGRHQGLIYDLYTCIFNPTNVPLWFLPCLFISSMMLHVTLRHTRGRSPFIAPVVIAAATVAGLYASSAYRTMILHDFGHIMANELVRFLYRIHISEAMIMLPIMYCGYLASAAGLHKRRPGRMLSVCITAVALSLIIFMPIPAEYSLYVHIWPAYTWLITISGIAAAVVIGMHARRLPVIHYMGRYSLICLCLHYIIIDGVKPYIFMLDIPFKGVIVLAVTLALTLLLIEPFRRYLAPFTGGADLISRIPLLRPAER